MNTLRIAVVAIARPTFDVALAQSVADRLVAALSESGVEVGGSGAALIMDADEARRAARKVAEEPIDLLILLQATFADSTMAGALADAAHRRGAPVLLWATPEVRDGGRLRLNSLCGINLAGHALTLARIPYEYVLAAPDDARARDEAMVLARAGRVRRLQGAMSIAVVGERPAGFETCDYDEGDLAELLGVGVRRVALSTVFEEARSVSDEQRREVVRRVRMLAPGVDDLDRNAVLGTAGVHVALKGLIEREGLSGVAVRCWPEFFTDLGCAACGAMSLLNEDGVPASCEADVNGTITSLLLQELAGTPAFLADLVSIDGESDSGVLWHCGLAPAAMADPLEAIGVTIHSNRKLPLLFEFGLKPGRVTIARLHRSSLAGGRAGYALAVGAGVMLRAPRSFGGTSGVVRFDKPAAEVLNVIMGNGIEHHLSLVYGDVRAEVRAFAKMSQLPTIELT